MKKSLLLSTLLLSTLAFSAEQKYEISPLLGVNSAEGNLGFENNSYITGGLEVQRNTSSKIAPELSIFYAPDVRYSKNGSTDVMRLMLNGVYTFSKYQTLTPFAKAGVGMEYFTTNKYGNEDRPFIDAGVGLKAAVTDTIAFKLETVYMIKHGFTHAGSADSNLVTLLGVTYAFGGTNQTKVVEDVYQEESSQTQQIVVEEPVKTVIPPVEVIPIVKDEPKQENKFEKQTTEKSVNLHITFKYKSTKVADESLLTIKEYAEFLKQHPQKRAKILGYTDDIGSAAYNKKLSKQRADAVVKLLIQEGVKPSQLVAIGMGEVNPIADNSTENGRAQNRRIEAELIK